MVANNTNKTVLITGATRGIGLGLATQYTNDGWNVIGGARNLNKADKLKALSPYKIIQIDTGDEASILQATKELDGEVIDLVINNAGIGEFETLESTTKASLLRHFEVNATGPFLLSRAFLPQLRAAAAKNGSATVAHVSSTLGSNSYDGELLAPGLHAYRASKAALNMLNSCLALDLKKESIVCVSLCPGFVATDMNGHTGHITTQESAGGLSKVIAGLNQEDSGNFISYDGSRVAW